MTDIPPTIRLLAYVMTALLAGALVAVLTIGPSDAPPATVTTSSRGCR